MKAEDIEQVIHGNVAECQAKLELVNDYLERFQIRDNRILAPIYDIERCIYTMVHFLHHQGEEDNLPGDH